MENSYRIHTNINTDTLLQVNMRQDFDFLEVLSLKLKQKDAYRIHSSNYGVIVGRVLANDAFGIPNARVSVFIERDSNDSSDVEALYPYTEINSKDKEGRRYNILPDYSDNDCYRVVGTFPNKRLMLDDNIQLEIFDKYWKYTTITNNAGDYMLFGVPTGSVQIHTDMDLSDIGVLSQKPRDFEYKGYNLTEFDSPSQFKESTNLDGLAQIFSQNKSVYVYPFWGDADNGVACITRSDIQIQYKFEPTCVFMGSIVSDNEGNAIGHKCAPSIDNGRNDQLVGGSGTIEMIRKTTDGLVEEYQIQGNQLIDDNGVWCYQIPMNLDYIGTDEYGNVVPTDNPNKGIPTRTQVRFRISKNETSDEGFSRHTAKYLVPMNPIFSEDKIVPTITMSGKDVEKMYVFGSATPEHCFRDLYWNNVYSVKNYIPKVQVSTIAATKNYSALKGANLATDQNPFPFNKLNVDLPFPYIAICILYEIVILIMIAINLMICFINKFILMPINSIIGLINKILKTTPIKYLGLCCVPTIPYIGCALISAGVNEGNVAYYPGCPCKEGQDAAGCPEDMEEGCVPSTDVSELKDKIQRNLALDYKIIKLDLYHDWINGCLYMPLWYWRKRKKKKFLFFTISGAKNEYCSDDKTYKRLRTYFGCNIRYTNNSFGVTNSDDSMPNSEKRWHKRRKGLVSFRRGVIKPVENKDGLTAYYYAATQATGDDVEPAQEMIKRVDPFPAIRLYATDIILLGNLDEDNIYGIPQFYKCLPYSTVNVPPIATIQEGSLIGESEGDGAGDSEESGTTVVTGMDWNHDGDEQYPMYQKGLFIDLACTYAGTFPKSCINVERLSELGVNLDMTYDTQYSNGSSLATGEMTADGFITKLELDDLENRAMFATLNHIGFIPQTYQDVNESYTTQVNDTNTNYLVPKFKYIYPVDFDGRMNLPMQLYFKNNQPTYDEADESYITFRLGAEKNDDKATNSEGRIRHFYHNNGMLDMPLYNNSYYFYFGINKGSTAIDKFNEMFYAPCFSNHKDPFTLDINSQGLSYCPSIYDDKNKAYGYIEVICEDISKNYSYTLYDSFNNVIVSEEGMDKDKFVIGGTYDTTTGEIIVNTDGIIMEQITNNELRDSGGNPIVITNQEYKLEITDNDGNVMTKKVSVSIPPITANSSTRNLGLKFYDTGSTPMNDICYEKDGFWGEITIEEVTIDGYVYSIDKVSNVTYVAGSSACTFTITGKSVSISSGKDILLNVVLSIKDENINEIKGCLCDARTSDIIGEITLDSGIIKINVYIPATYEIKLTQMCDGAMTSNSSFIITTVGNGSNFETFINEMPTRFLGNYFYDKNVTPITIAKGNSLSGWLGVHEGNAYNFLPDTKANSAIWEDLMGTMMYDIRTPISKREILKYKFDTMFSLCEGVYMTSKSSKNLRMTSKGGVEPILNREVIPTYDNEETLSVSYVSDDYTNATCNPKYPNVVSDGSKPIFNTFYTNHGGKLGNYFAVFTRDGGYTDDSNIDTSLKIMRSPEGASVNPLTNKIKKKGEDVIGDINSFNKAHNANPYYRTLFVDRAIGCDLVLLSPYVGSTPTILSINELHKKGRIYGSIRNGIEMAYDADNDYNIVSANLSAAPKAPSDKTEGIDVLYSAATENDLLEYSYRYTSSDDGSFKFINSDTSVIPIYNEAKSNIRWGTWNTFYSNGTNKDSLSDETFGYDALEDGYIKSEDKYDDKRPLMKQFYSATLNGHDIRHLLWSSFNKDRLFKLVNNASVNSPNNDFYVLKWPKDKPSLYNSDFNMNSAFGNYPTTRYINIAMIPADPEYTLSIQSCSYDMTTIINSDGSIKIKTKGGEKFEVSFDMEYPCNLRYYTKIYNCKTYIGYSFDGKISSALTTYEITKINGFSAGIAITEDKNFVVQEATIRLVNILPGDGGKDGMTLIKGSDSNGELGGVNMTLNDALNKINLNKATFTEMEEIPEVVEVNAMFTSLTPTLVGIILDCNLEERSSSAFRRIRKIDIGELCDISDKIEVVNGSFDVIPISSSEIRDENGDLVGYSVKARTLEIKAKNIPEFTGSSVVYRIYFTPVLTLGIIERDGIPFSADVPMSAVPSSNITPIGTDYVKIKMENFSGVMHKNNIYPISYLTITRIDVINIP